MNHFNWNSVQSQISVVYLIFARLHSFRYLDYRPQEGLGETPVRRVRFSGQSRVGAKDILSTRQHLRLC